MQTASGSRHQQVSLALYQQSAQFGTQAHVHARQAAQSARQSHKDNGGQQKDESLSVVARHTASNTTTTTNTSSSSSSSSSSGNSSNTWSMLDLGGTRIHALSQALFGHYAFLTVLYLNHNNLFQLPAEIRLLRHLQVLDVSSNRLRQLPAEIGQLFQLKELWLFDNLIEDLPWDICFLKDLEMLGLDGNPIAQKLNPYYQIIDPSVSDDLRSMRYEHPMMEVLVREGAQGLVAWVRDMIPVEVLVPHPVPQRRWIRKLPSTPIQRKLRVASYNILAERYATQQQYWYTPSWALDISHRRRLLLAEILNTHADVVCLQEIDTIQFEEWWMPQLCGEVGGFVSADKLPPHDPSYQSTTASTRESSVDMKAKYASVFLPKSRYKTMPGGQSSSASLTVNSNPSTPTPNPSLSNTAGGGSTPQLNPTSSSQQQQQRKHAVDGCAIFYRRDRFKRIGVPMTVEFGQLALQRQDFEKCDTMFERFCARDNVAVGVVLEDQWSGNQDDKEGDAVDKAKHKDRVFVCNVHIHWDPLATDVKLVQCVMLMAEIEKYLKRFNEQYSTQTDNNPTAATSKMPIVLCGDFNSLPQSLVYEYLSSASGVRDFDGHPDLVDCFEQRPSGPSGKVKADVQLDRDESKLASEVSTMSVQSSQSSLSLGGDGIDVATSVIEDVNPSVSAVGSSVKRAQSQQQNMMMTKKSASQELLSSANTTLSATNAGQQQQQQRKWKSWKESGYGEISKMDVLKHAFSGQIQSAYKSIDGVPIEDQNVFIPPASHLAAKASHATSGQSPPHSASADADVINQLVTHPIPALSFTNHTAGFTGVIDYLFVSDEFEVQAVLGGYFYEEVSRDLVRWIEEVEHTQPGQGIAGGRASVAGQGQVDGIVQDPKSAQTLVLPPSHPHQHHQQNLQGHQQPKVWTVKGTRTIGFPNPHFPSDHIPVVCDLILRPSSSQAQVQGQSGKSGNGKDMKSGGGGGTSSLGGVGRKNKR